MPYSGRKERIGYSSNESGKRRDAGTGAIVYREGNGAVRKRRKTQKKRKGNRIRERRKGNKKEVEERGDEKERASPKENTNYRWKGNDGDNDEDSEETDWDCEGIVKRCDFACARMINDWKRNPSRHKSRRLWEDPCWKGSVGRGCSDDRG